MIHQRIILEKYGDWVVDVFYGVTHYDVDKVMIKLHEIGCNGSFARQAYENLSSGELNNGLTYSNYRNNQSVMAIGVADSAEQVINTLTHEQMHLATHIGKTYGMDMCGEEVCYLVGTIAQKMFPVSRQLLCDCECCKEKLIEML